MKKFVFIGIITILFLLLIVFGVYKYDSFYYSNYVDSESFKTSSVEDKVKILDNQDFRKNCDDKTKEKVVDLIANSVNACDDIYLKIEFLDHPDFIHYASAETRKKLLESIVDTPNISDETFSNFLFKVCRTVDFKIVAERIEEKKYSLSSKVIEAIKKNMNYLASFSGGEIWKDIVKRNSVDIENNFNELANEAINSKDIGKKIEFYKRQDFLFYGSLEIKKKLFVSMINNINLQNNKKFVDFLFEECGSEDFKLVGELIENSNYVIDTELFDLIKRKMEKSSYGHVEVWKRIIDKIENERKQKISNSLEDAIKNGSIDEKLNIFKLSNSGSLLSAKDKDRLIDSIITTPDITDDKLISFFVDYCSEDEFYNISKDIYRKKYYFKNNTITKITSNIFKRHYRFGDIWNFQIRGYVKQRDKEKVIFSSKNYIDGNIDKSAIELFVSGEFSDYATVEIKRSLLDSILKNIDAFTFDDKMKFLNNRVFKAYAKVEARDKVIKSIIDTPNISDEQIISFLKICKASELRIVLDRMAVNNRILTTKLASTIIRYDMYVNQNKETLDKLFKDNPVAKREVAFQAKILLKARVYDKVIKLNRAFNDLLQVEPDSNLYEDIESLKDFKDKRYFAANKNFPVSDEDSNSDNVIIRRRILEHFNKVYDEYNEIKKDTPNADH